MIHVPTCQGGEITMREPLPLSPSPLPPLPSFSLCPFLSLEVGPLSPARGSGDLGISKVLGRAQGKIEFGAFWP